jgi:parallel beta-helix repeat protein
MRRLALAALIAAGCSGCATGATGDPETISHDGASISGRVISDTGGQVEYWAEYGPSTSYGSEGEHGTINTLQNTSAPVIAAFDGLARSTTYHYRLCAQDGSQRGGPACGDDRTLKTQSFACGETVKANVRFTGNASCQSDSGLVIGASGIQIDMNGFGLTGPIFVGGGGAPGIDNSGGFDDVTIRDGQIGNFGDGIHLEDASRNRVLHVRSFGPQDGIDIRRGHGNEVRHSSATGRGSGLIAIDTTGLVVADSGASGSFGSGMALSGLVASRLVRNEVVAGGNPCCTNFGITVAGNDNVIKDNRIGHWDGGNLRLASGANNKLLGNEVLGGVLPEIEPDALDSSGDGIFVGAFTAGTVLRGNSAHGNEGDGIEVQGTASRLGDNRANGNGDFGIDAATGVTDLGGNTASGNGNPVQCRNVFCQ